MPPLDRPFNFWGGDTPTHPVVLQSPAPPGKIDFDELD
jgi:hypothetical protein